MRILIVEDDSDGGEILRELFESEGFDVDWVRAGERAIELAGEEAFDAALVDLSLPDVDGTEVLLALRRTLPHAALALVTGFSPGALDEAAQRIADRIFVKPVDPEVLLAFVRDATHAGSARAVDAHSHPA